MDDWNIKIGRILAVNPTQESPKFYGQMIQAIFPDSNWVYYSKEEDPKRNRVQYHEYYECKDYCERYVRFYQDFVTIGYLSSDYEDHELDQIDYGDPKMYEKVRAINKIKL